jgi:hypothetical protein
MSIISIIFDGYKLREMISETNITKVIDRFFDIMLGVKYQNFNFENSDFLITGVVINCDINHLSNLYIFLNTYCNNLRIADTTNKIYINSLTDTINIKFISVPKNIIKFIGNAKDFFLLTNSSFNTSEIDFILNTELIKCRDISDISDKLYRLTSQIAQTIPRYKISRLKIEENLFGPLSVISIKFDKSVNDDQYKGIMMNLEYLKVVGVCE